MAAVQLHYEDVARGAELPPLVKVPTRTALVRYCAASNDFSPVHFDLKYARARGMPDVIVQGFFKAACLGQLVTDWAGASAWVKKIATRYQRINVPDEAMTCRGRVVDKYVRDGEHLVEIELWVENARGETTTTGRAVVLLPSHERMPSAGAGLA